MCYGFGISDFKHLSICSGTNRNHSVFFPIFFIAFILGLLSVTEIPFIDHVKAQSNQVFRVNVEVTNNGNMDEYGTVYVDINDSPAVDGLGGQLFPAGKTVTFEFVFDSKEIPIGKDFVAEVVHDDDLHKRAYGKNTSINSSETVSINMP